MKQTVFSILNSELSQLCCWNQKLYSYRIWGARHFNKKSLRIGWSWLALTKSASYPRSNMMRARRSKRSFEMITFLHVPATCLKTSRGVKIYGILNSLVVVTRGVSEYGASVGGLLRNTQQELLGKFSLFQSYGVNLKFSLLADLPATFIRERATCMGSFIFYGVCSY